MNDWSDELKALTRKTLTELPVVSFMRSNSCFLKHHDGRYGTLSLLDAMGRRYHINVLNARCEILRYRDLDELIEAGWVVD